MEARAIEPEPGEDFPQFQQRVRAMGQSESVRLIVYGGLPHGPVEWATPPGMEEALAQSSNFGRDEIDLVAEHRDIANPCPDGEDGANPTV